MSIITVNNKSDFIKITENVPKIVHLQSISINDDLIEIIADSGIKTLTLSNCTLKEKYREFLATSGIVNDVTFSKCAITKQESLREIDYARFVKQSNGEMGTPSSFDSDLNLHPDLFDLLKKWDISASEVVKSAGNPDDEKMDKYYTFAQNLREYAQKYTSTLSVLYHENGKKKISRLIYRSNLAY